MAGGDDKGAIALFGGGRSKPLALSLAGVYALAREFSRLGAIMIFTYVCEHFPFFPHAAKSHDMDLFWSLTAALFLAAAFTVRKSKSTDLLHREQTEEWKGWMQFMFLLYHYLHAGEVYNAIRVMITCYVWMTGFGNFSFFYIKDDFSAVRVLQMLWRLNFLVGLLMLVHGNTYILYYICPLHTFYFLMTYVVMRVGRGMNRSKWGIRAKIMIVSVIIYLVWDTQLGLFDLLFGWVGATPKMGGTAGTLYEWYFRTSLDHYSTILGMVFALNYPVAKAFFDTAGKLPGPQKALVLGVGSVGALGILGFWFSEYYTLPKVPYNATNAYMAPVALLCYVFLRNALPVMRSYHSELLHDIGKTTLETYLLQHHLWLTSNAKTLLVLVPGMPKLNFLLVSCVYYGCAKECYRLTMSLRGMFLPDGSVYTCLRNLLGLTAVVVAALVAGAMLTVSYMGRVEHLIAILGIGLLVAFATLVILDRKKAERINGPSVTAEFVRTAPRLACVGFIAVIIARTYNPAMDRPTAHPASCMATVQDGAWLYRTNIGTLECLGAYDVNQDGDEIEGWKALEEQAGACETLAWQWKAQEGDAAGCGFRMLNKWEATQRVRKGMKIAVVGDSEARNVYYALRRMFIGDDSSDDAKRHSDLTRLEPTTGSKPQVGFYWAPKVEDIRLKLASLYNDVAKPDAIVFSAGLWDTLHNGNLDDYEGSLRETAGLLHTHEDMVYMFMQPPRVVDSKLNTPEKLEKMKEEQVAKYRKVAEKNLPGKVDLLLNFHQLTSESFSPSHSVDGVHYARIYYDVVAQQVANALPYAAEAKGLNWDLPENQSRETGGMADPAYGIGVLIAIAVMLVTFDSFAGITLAPARLFGTPGLRQALRYDEAYRPFLANASSASAPPVAASAPKKDEGLEQKVPFLAGKGGANV
mmetsp:Transcript_42103/g.131826  ORF Transcript_42103/g.131826 Transcript_42103/m.131826 type:complete len:920 (-) Transcript_42103:866-3625(-)